MSRPIAIHFYKNAYGRDNRGHCNRISKYQTRDWNEVTCKSCLLFLKYDMSKLSTDAQNVSKKE